MFKALLVGMAMLIGIVFVGATSAAAQTVRPSTDQTLACPNDMHWGPC